MEYINADLKDLVSTKRSKALPVAFVFGESKVTTNLIREYEAARFFPASSGHAPLDKEVPSLKTDKIVVFRDFLPTA
jgi:hypothetical protein